MKKIYCIFALVLLIGTVTHSIGTTNDMTTNEKTLMCIQNAIKENDASWVAGFNSIFTPNGTNNHGIMGCIKKETNETDLESLAMLDDLPDSYDWRNVNGKNYVTSVKSQTLCGSCTAFGTIGALEAVVQIEYDTIFDCDLSEAHVFFCGGGSCKSGMSISAATNFLENIGAVDERCFPYKPIDMDCDEKASNWEKRLITVDNTGEVNGLGQIREALITYGPLITSMKIYEDFQSYNGGIYEHVWGSFVSRHTVTLIGYDINSSYWICKNSWGKGWGEDGFFRIKYAECDIAGTAYYIDNIGGNIQPFKPINISPEDGTKNCDLDVTITWKSGDINNDEVTYSIFFNEGYYTNINNDPLAEGLTDCHFQVEDLQIATTYSIRILAEDEHGSQQISDDIMFTTRSLLPPVIDGPKEGRIGRKCTYSASTNDIDGELYYWFFDWGDGEDSGWLGPYGPNDVVTASHSWHKNGNYNVSVRYNRDGLLSEWKTLEVSMSKTKTHSQTFLNFLENHHKLFPFLKQLAILLMNT